MSLQISLILHNIRSMENVGSMFRTADAFGVTRIYITGYTPAPTDRFGREVGKIAKTALGAEVSVPWQKVEISECVAELKQNGVRIVALEQDPRSVPLQTYVRNPGVEQMALLVGNEVTGVEPEVLALAEDVIEISMMGKKESLNVAVATGIALFHLSRP
ncbi:MAG: TrmH family RNA methyltransferase [Patescibacteria group bacterium]